MQAAIVCVLDATWLRCRVHWTRNVLAYVLEGQHTKAFHQPDHSAARIALLHAAEMMRPRLPKLADFIIDGGAAGSRPAGIPGSDGA